MATIKNVIVTTDGNGNGYTLLGFSAQPTFLVAQHFAEPLTGYPIIPKLGQGATDPGDEEYVIVTEGPANGSVHVGVMYDI
ncbi:MAG: hypothetical protein ACRDX8_02390 [Acidimicrobiales bacterium]